jgi:hypothetical protein
MGSGVMRRRPKFVHGFLDRHGKSRFLAAMSWQRPNIGSRMNREVHVRVSVALASSVCRCRDSHGHRSSWKHTRRQWQASARRSGFAAPGRAPWRQQLPVILVRLPLPRLPRPRASPGSAKPRQMRPRKAEDRLERTWAKYGKAISRRLSYVRSNRAGDEQAGLRREIFHVFGRQEAM